MSSTAAARSPPPRWPARRPCGPVKHGAGRGPSSPETALGWIWSRASLRSSRSCFPVEHRRQPRRCADLLVASDATAYPLRDAWSSVGILRSTIHQQLQAIHSIFAPNSTQLAGPVGVSQSTYLPCLQKRRRSRQPIVRSQSHPAAALLHHPLPSHNTIISRRPNQFSTQRQANHS